MNDSVWLENLHKSFVLAKGWAFRRTYSEILAVDHISLAVPEGQSVAFIGPNGAGKSTTIKMLTGILRPTSGTARVLGVVPWEQRQKLAFQIGVVLGNGLSSGITCPPRTHLTCWPKFTTSRRLSIRPVALC